MKLRPGKFREVTWDEVRGEVQKLAPDLFDAIESMSPDKSYKLYEATYPYGASLLDGNQFIIPFESGYEYIGSSKIKKEIKEQLAYHLHYGTPFGLVLDGRLQSSYSEPDQSKTAAQIFNCGDVFALRAALDYPNQYQAAYYWNMESGVSTTYMLASLADKRKFKNVQKEFGLEIDMPFDQVDHWIFFRALANSDSFKAQWNSRLLLFGKKWIEKLRENKELRFALLERLFDLSLHSRNQDTFDKLWNDFIPTIRNKKVDRYILSMARYIFDTAVGKTLSFKVADTENQAGPFTEIADIIANVYQLEKYVPLIMVPTLFSPTSQETAYVSIRFPIPTIERFYTSKSNFLMADYREIAYVINKFISSIRKEVIEEVPLYNMKNYNYNFYSADKDGMNGFLPAGQAFDNNKDFDFWTQFGNKEVNTKNPFMRACVGISHKK